MWTEIEVEFRDPKGNVIFVTVGGNVRGNEVTDITFTSQGVDLTLLLQDSEGDYISDLIAEAAYQKTEAMFGGEL
jgi:hypothetical protein